MINQNNIPSFHKQTEQFNSYFSVIPEFPEFCTTAPKQKCKKTYSLKSLTKKFTRKSISISKKVLDLDKKGSQCRKMNKQSSKKLFSAGSNFDQLQSLASTKWAHKLKTPRQRVSNTLKSSKKSCSSKKSQAQLTVESMLESAGRSSQSSEKLQFQAIYCRIRNVLSNYEQKIERLQRENKKLQLSNYRMLQQLKDIKL